MLIPDLFFYCDLEEADKKEGVRKPEIAVPTKEDWGGETEDWSAESAAAGGIAADPAPAVAAPAAAPAGYAVNNDWATQNVPTDWSAQSAAAVGQEQTRSGATNNW